MNSNVKKLGWAVAIGLFAGTLWFGLASAAELKVGSVDIQKAINECNAGKDAKKDLSKEA